MRNLATLLYYIVALVFIVEDVGSIDNARLVLPPVVRAGTTATFLCLYDLEGALLYSVKWYRGRHEFFRYAPSEEPSRKVFTFPGIYVDALSSNEHQVTLRNIPKHLSGEVTCEITIEAPHFSTSVVAGNLTVIELDIELLVPRRYLYVGDTLTALCRIVCSEQKTYLAFHLNSRKVGEQQFIIAENETDSAILEMNVTSYELNLQRQSGGDLHLRCSASVDTTYHVTSEAVAIHIEEPIERKITSNSANDNVLYCWCLLTVLLILVSFIYV